MSTESIRELVEPVLASIGLDLWDVEVAHDVVRIMVERPTPAGDPDDLDHRFDRPALVDPPAVVDPPALVDPPAVVDPPALVDPPGPSDPPGQAGGRRGVDLDALSDASSVLSPVLDAHPEAVPAGRYQLEVSSPGIERTLRTPEQFRRYIGAEITVRTSEPVAGARRHRGRLVEVGATGIDLEPDVDPSSRLQVRFDQVNRARTVMDWALVTGGPTPGQHAAGRRAPGRKPAHGPTSPAHTSKDPAS